MRDEGFGTTGGAFRVPAAEIEHRLGAFQRRLAAAGAEAALVVQRADLFYLAGTAQNSFLYVPAEGAPVLFVRRYLPRARAESPLAEVAGIGSVRELPQQVAERCGRLPKRLAMELDVLPVNDFRFYRELLGRPEVLDASPMLLAVRQVKSAWELAQMARTAEMTRQTFAYMAEILRPGLTEMEFAGLFEARARRLGHGGGLRVRHFLTEGYPWHVLSGPSGGLVGLLDSPASGEGTSAAFPVGAGHKVIAEGEPIMVDFGSVRNGYHLDETRMFAIGRMPPKALAASQAAIEVHDALIAAAAPGVTTGEIFAQAVKMAARMGFGEVFLGPPGHRVRFVGHGIGVELIEPPIIARDGRIPLRAGMTLALEPKLVWAGEFCAGIESVFTVTERGGRLISRVPVEVFVC